MYQALPTLPYCKRRKAGRWPGNKASINSHPILAPVCSLMIGEYSERNFRYKICSTVSVIHPSIHTPHRITRKRLLPFLVHTPEGVSHFMSIVPLSPLPLLVSQFLSIVSLSPLPLLVSQVMSIVSLSLCHRS